MKNRILKFTISVLAMIAWTAGFAQSRYRFFTLGAEQGLTSDFAWSVCQDKYNYIWIGTQNGLNRYDGHNIKQYYHSTSDSFSIPGNSIYWMLKDHDGDLWFSLGYAGAARYNYAKDRFERFAPFDSIRKKNKYSAPLWRMGTDQQKRIYFACGATCFRYTKTTGKMEDLTPLFKGQVTEGVAMFIPQGDDLLWILTDNGLFRFDLLQNNMKKIDFDVEKMGFGSEAMHDAEFINDHEMIITLERPGFVLFDTRSGKFRLPPAPFDPTITKKYSETGAVLKDSKGRVWLANSRFGLMEYFPATNSAYSLKNERSYPYPYNEQEGNGMHVYEDNNGNIWYSNSSKGVIWFKPQADFIQVFQRDFSKEQSLPDNEVTYFLPLDDHKVMIGTNKGVTEFDANTNEFKTFPFSLNSRENFPGRFVRSMVYSNDSVYITTSDGLSIYNRKKSMFSRYVPQIRSADIMPHGLWMIHMVAPGRLFMEGEHVMEFHVKDKQLVYPGGRGAIDTIADINASWYDDRTKTFWVEGRKAKLYSYDLASKKLKEHQYAAEGIVKMIDAIRCDENGLVWLATTAGLFRYDPVSKTGKKIVLHSTVPQVLNIAIQDNDWIWLATPGEIIRYNTINGAEVNLSINALFPNSVIMKRAFMLDKEKYLWIGTNKGFGRIDTRRFFSRDEPMQPQLVRFSVFDKELHFNKPYAEISSINLRHTENFFSFQLSSFDFTAGNLTRYSYRLDDFDKDWHQALSNTGSYTNVPPGVYKLRIRSTDNTGGWAENASPLTIHIHPPFYGTWWFILLISIIAVVFLYFIYRFIQNRKKKAEIESAIDYFANSLYAESNVTEICWDIARNCISQLKLNDCVVYLLDEKKNRLIKTAAYGTKNPGDHEIMNPMEIEVNKGIVGTVAKNGTYLLINDTSKDSRYIVDNIRHSSELAVPIIHEGKTIGVIDSEHPRKGFFTMMHVKALSTIAGISANKIAEAKADQAARDTEIKLLEISKLLAESQLMALRAQMNPHFVFNCLNSIQEFILTENYEQASLYLNKFSRLFRSVLNNSGKVLISLAEEIEVLDMYLSLEHMRFERSFSYTIDVDEDLEVDEILIPSMLLQPYVENALWHGLMHKNEDRVLNVRFKKINEDIFECSVEDNGIGRKKAMEIKEQEGNRKRHVSKGMSISRDRVDLLQKQGYHAQLDIIDKTDDENVATGTKVVIELSAYLKT